MAKQGSKSSSGGGTDHVETEWRFEAEDLGAVEGSIGALSENRGFCVVADEAWEIQDTYLDTHDWRLYRAGYALRIRRTADGTEATMKSLAGTTDGVGRREISEPLGDGELEAPKAAPGPVGERLRALAGARGLHPLFEIRTRRRTFELRPDRTAEEPDVSAGEVALDDTEIRLADGREPAHLRRVEVEAGDSGEVEGIVEALRGSPGLRPATGSKFEAGLAAAGLIPDGPPEFDPTDMRGSQTAGEVAFAVLRRHFAVMLAREPGVRLGEVPEELHDMRVATRRLRSALKLYGDFLPKRAARYERDLRYVGDALGEVRDLDVQLGRLAVPAEDRGVCGIIAAIEGRRREARERMLEVLDSRRYERFARDFAGTLRRGHSPSPPGSILDVAPDLVRRRHRKVRKAAARISAASPPEDFHDLRKKGRRLRYALESLGDVYGKPAQKMVVRFKELQDDLGEHQDAAVAAELLEEMALAGDLPPQTIFAMGAEAERQAREAQQMRATISGSRAFRAIEKGKAWKKLRKTMEGRTAEKVGG
jgi:triphosphatase